ncbi:hypothetical protein I6E17_04540 [Fusobacterium perfoetens]|uniref:hypothetical protein n=1 Tax=Fusobacterium perfoetens TaxID=852 RepID=UPI001F3DCFC9|nr:hypothetical protein [Fusobacterium perfoetens]MCF2625448.1 hypothetical protein [Fusobacterium perfoetens]
MVKDYKITKNPNELMINYRQKLLDLEKQKELATGKIQQLESMIKAYKLDDKNIVIMNNGNSEKINTNTENYYTEFLRQLADEKIKLSNILVEIKDINKKMNQTLNTDSSKIEEINKELNSVITSANINFEKINNLTVKNYNKKYSDIIKITESVTTKSSSKTMFITLIGFILGGFLGICYVLIRNFIFEEKKKQKNNI